MSGKVTRRTMLQKTGAAAAGAMAAGMGIANAGCAANGNAPSPEGETLAVSARRATGGGNRTRVLRVAHLTDIHVPPEPKGGEGFAACLRHIHALADRPDLIVNGGDMVMDSLGAGEDRMRVQWDLFTHILKTECTIPIEHCIGNHDVWGWDRNESPTTGKEPLFGKGWVMDAVGLSARYRSFDRAGWHFIFLDSTHPTDRGSYTARLDDEQFEWLAADLALHDPNTPTLLLSHIPILSACAYLDGDNEKSGNWNVPGAWMHIDARRIKDLFLKHPNVKLCLSGHIHLVDRVEYLGVTYLCNGAVCGGWWGGPYQECDCGYALLDLYDDGTFDSQYVNFGWVVEKKS